MKAGCEVLSFAGAIAALAIGAVLIQFIAQDLEGRRSYFLHFGLLTLVVLVGGVGFWFWGWSAVAWVLGLFALLGVGPPLWRRFVRGETADGYICHGDDLTSEEDEENQRP